MKERLFDLLVGAFVGAMIVGATSLTCYDRSVAKLQAYSHQVALNSAALYAHAGAQADSFRQRANSLEVARRPIIILARRDAVTAARLDSSLTAQQTAHDSIDVLLGERDALKVSNANLWAALASANAETAIERVRGDSLAKAVGDLNLQLQALAVRVADLRPPPKWLRISWRVAEDAGFLWAGYQWGKHERCKAC